MEESQNMQIIVPEYKLDDVCIPVVRSPPPTSLNNSCLLSSGQSNFHVLPAAHMSGKLAKKIQNKNGGPVSPSTRKPIMLNHLPARPPVDIHFNNLTYSISEGRKRGYKTILKGVNGRFLSGELSAILGPSGAGKSTLMNILAGYKMGFIGRRLTGSVTVNGRERNLRRFRKFSCYIMQDDHLLPHLTVLEAMTVSANLKLGKEVKDAEKQVVIEEILEALGLVECSQTRTLNLSGGQRKRLSIALELVNNPPVMFFDEPTSGLDSSSCFQCISLLKSLSRGGRTIICTIHQPSARIFEMFDYLYTLADGQCLYQGSIPGLVPFLSSMGLDCPNYHNPADFVMEVATGEHGDCAQRLVVAVADGKCGSLNMKEVQQTPTEIPEGTTKIFRPQLNGSVNKTSTSTTLTVPVTCASSLLDSDESLNRNRKQKIGFPTSSWTQFYILLKRTFLTILRDKTLTRIRLISHIIVGLLIGFIYEGIGNDAFKVLSNSGCMFIAVLFLIFTAMMPTILTFPMERTIFVREHLNYWYSLKSFYLAKTTADIPFQVLFSIVYVTIIYFMTSQPLDASRFVMVLCVCILTSLVSQSIGLLIGAAMNVQNGVYLGPVCTVPFILFSGFFVNFDTIPKYLHWLTYISFIRYAFEGIIISLYGYNRKRLDCSEAYCHFRSPTKFLERLNMSQAQFWIDALALSLMFVFLRVVSYFVLRWKVSSRS
ncbi:hypothetical protein RUM44_012051 [Polyplax serrata]|uniref:ABC transporter domain-containing protein n=1 Tax=Polyplax serrata TaxID=468196 RepID=A0ABR1BF44_POLSC